MKLFTELALASASKKVEQPSPIFDPYFNSNHSYDISSSDIDAHCASHYDHSTTTDAHCTSLFGCPEACHTSLFDCPTTTFPDTTPSHANRATTTDTRRTSPLNHATKTVPATTRSHSNRALTTPLPELTPVNLAEYKALQTNRKSYKRFAQTYRNTLGNIQDIDNQAGEVANWVEFMIQRYRKSNLKQSPLEPPTDYAATATTTPTACQPTVTTDSFVPTSTTACQPTVTNDHDAASA